MGKMLSQHLNYYRLHDKVFKPCKGVKLFGILLEGEATLPSPEELPKKCM